MIEAKGLYSIYNPNHMDYTIIDTAEDADVKSVFNGIPWHNQSRLELRELPRGNKPSKDHSSCSPGSPVESRCREVSIM